MFHTEAIGHDEEKLFYIMYILTKYELFAFWCNKCDVRKRGISVAMKRLWLPVLVTLC